MVAQQLTELLADSLASLPDGPLLVAFSGGLDSSVLLHLLSASKRARARGLRAIHIDHGLQGDSALWAQHCAQFARALEVELISRSVEVPEAPGLGLEANARRARYGAIESVLRPDEIVAFAQHRDDQAETVLLKLLRGAGPQGLGAMRNLRRLGPGFAWRPLLSTPRAVLRDYARGHGLAWLNDPSNADLGIDRNFLRHQVLPQIVSRWPEAASSIAQTAIWMQAAADFIADETERAFGRVRGPTADTLQLEAWLGLHTALRDPVLRYWLRALGLAQPTHYQVAELLRQLTVASEDRQPCIRWSGAEVRRYRDLLYAMPPLKLPAPDWVAGFDGSDLQLPLDLGVLRLSSESSEARLAKPLRVRFRRGGESLRLNRGNHSSELRDLFQQAGIPPWQRARLPLVFDHDEHLLAVADLWLGQAGAELLRPLAARLQWERGCSDLPLPRSRRPSD